MPIASCIFAGLLASRYWALGGLVLGHGGLALGHGELTLGELAPRGLDLRHGCLALEGLALIAITDVSIMMMQLNNDDAIK